MGYRQLTQTQRYQIHDRYDLGVSQRQIGRELGIHSSTISRELRCNATSGGHDPEQAQSLSDHRPAEVNDRRIIGHWEVDTVIQGHKQSGLVTLVERLSGYLLAARLPRISAELTPSYARWSRS